MKYYLLVVLYCIIHIAHSQNCNNILSGNVHDFHDGTPMSGATIYIETLNTYTVANINGDFAINNLCNGIITLVISHVGCETKRVNIEVESNTTYQINMEHHTEALNEVQINSKGSTRLSKTAQETQLKTKTLERYSAFSLGDALKQVSGVSSINTGSTIVKPIINGLHSSRITTITNGVRLQDQEWGIEHAPSIDINSADQISVIKGSAGLAYGGDAIGGIIIIKPTSPVLKDTLYGKTIFGSNSNGKGYNVNTRVNKNYKSGWFSKIQASFKKNGDFEAPNYNLTNTGLNAKALSANFGKKTFVSGFEVYYSFIDSEIAILGASHVASAFDLERAINSGVPVLIKNFSYKINVPKQNITHHLLKGSYFKRFKKFGKINLQYDYQNNQRFEFDVRIGERRKIPAVDLRLQTHSLLADVKLDTNLNRKINFGIMMRSQNNFASPNTGVKRLIPDYNKYDFGTYATIQARPFDNLIIDAGMRYDFNRIDAKKFYRKSRWEELGYNTDFSDIIIKETPTQFLTNPIFNYHNVSASTGANYSFNKNHEIILNYSLTSRPPNASELFSDGLHHSASRFEIGNIRFNKEISNRVSLSYTYNQSEFYFLVETFYNKLNNYIYLRPVNFINTIRGPFSLWEYQQTNAALFGIDFTSSYHFTNALFWKNKTAFIKGYDLNTDTPLIDIPAFNTINEITYNSKAWCNFSASLKSDWVFEQNEFPDFNFNIENRLNGEITTIDISSPPPAYHLLHFYSEATFSLGKKTHLNVGIGVNNIFNTTYRNYLNRLRFFADDLGRNITMKLQLNY